MTAPEHGGSSPILVKHGGEKQEGGAMEEAAKDLSELGITKDTAPEQQDLMRSEKSEKKQIPEGRKESGTSGVVADAVKEKQGMEGGKEGVDLCIVVDAATEKKSAHVIEVLKENSKGDLVKVVEISKGKSWALVAKTNLSNSLQKLDVSVKEIDGVPTLTIPDCAFEDAPLWDDCFIGRFPSKAPHVVAIHATVN